MLIKSLQLTNLLSFGPETPALELCPLNVLIGPNGSGKSNFLEALALLQAAPRDLTTPFQDAGVRVVMVTGDNALPLCTSVILASMFMDLPN